MQPGISPYRDRRYHAKATQSISNGINHVNTVTGCPENACDNPSSVGNGRYLWLLGLAVHVNTVCVTLLLEVVCSCVAECP